MDLPMILTQLRAEKGIYQKELATVLNVSIGTISNYESGIHAPDLETLCHLAEFYGVTTDYLLGRTKYRYPNKWLSRQLTRDYTVAELVNTTLELPREDIAAIIEWVSLLKTRRLYHEIKMKELNSDAPAESQE